MKTLFRTPTYILIAMGILTLAVATLIAQRAKGEPQPGKVEFLEDGIVLHPAVPLTQQESDALDTALKRHANAIFVIRTVENDRVSDTKTGPQGTQIHGDYESYYAPTKEERQKGGHTHRTHNVHVCGSSCNTAFKKAWDPSSVEETRRLIQELKPILEKYK